MSNNDTCEIVIGGESYPETPSPSTAHHFETPVATDGAAVFCGDAKVATWDGKHGAEHLDGCDTGLHWIWNGNVLTISHCLDTETTTTTVVVTTTAAPTTTTTLVGSDVGSAPTTTVETTTTTPTVAETEGGSSGELPTAGVDSALLAGAALTFVVCGWLLGRFARGEHRGLGR
jgi:hypothetical protein